MDPLIPSILHISFEYFCSKGGTSELINLSVKELQPLVGNSESKHIIEQLLMQESFSSLKDDKAVVTNLISFIEEYGFVLNGDRAYYTNRSQPPLLSAMIYEIYSSTGDIELVKRSLAALLKEHEFWNSDIHKVTILDAQGCTHTLNRYYAIWNKPRPESSIMDKASASKFFTVSEKQYFYRELASAAESGWDFSTRWMRYYLIYD